MNRNQLLAFLLGAAAIAPTSSLVTSIEGEGVAGGGGGATPNDTAAPSAAASVASTPAAPAAPADGEAFTPAQQARVDRIVADRLARDRASRGTTNGQPAPAAPAAPPAPEQRSHQTLAERQTRLEAENAFYRGIGRVGVSLTEEQEADLFQLFLSQKPERPGEWVQSKVALFGLGQKPVTPAASPTAPALPAATSSSAVPAPVAPAVAATGAAPNGVDAAAPGGLVDVSKLTSAQIAAMGPQGVRTALEKVLASNQGRDGRPALPAALRPKA